MPKRERYLWVCTNERAKGHPKGCCGSKGSKAISDALKAGLARRGIHRKFRVMQSSCMDLCWIGPTVAVSPDDVFYGRLKPSDVEEILDSLESGRPVERLMVPIELFDDPARAEEG
jgi:(2Fe-2S) ferredoxin